MTKIFNKNTTNDNKNGMMNISFDFFMDENNNDLILPDTAFANNIDNEPKKKRKPRKKMDKNIVTETDDDNQSSNLSMTQSNESYTKMYDDTNNLLKATIFQLDGLNGDIREQIDAIKHSKTLKKKYDYLSNLVSSAGGVLSAKITAIRELNKSITDANNLELKRAKDLKLNNADIDDDTAIMNMYKAYVSTPIGTYDFAAPPMPNTSDITMAGNPNMVGVDIGEVPPHQFKSTEHMMLLESDPNIQTVVMFNNATGQKWFDVINLQTGESISNVEKPDPMFLEDVTLDMKNKIARNTNLNQTYPLIVINQDIAGSGLSEY